MARVAKEIRFNGTVPTTPLTSYDPDKVNLGTLMYQRTGAGGADNFVGPLPLPMARPAEDGPVAHATGLIHAVSWSSNIDYVFLHDSPTNVQGSWRIVLYTFDRSTAAFTFQGFITCTSPHATGNITGSSMRAMLNRYTTGTAAVSGTAVTGTGTAWSTDRMSVGSRIGFGSTDPTQIVTWYEISAVGGDTSITLTASAGSISDGPYVIEDLQVATTSTNTTAANGGVFVTKGLRFANFTPTGTTIPVATTVDNIRAVYKLEASPTLQTLRTTSTGPMTSWTDQRSYHLNGTTTMSIAVLNIRAALTGLSGGISSAAYLFVTGASAAFGTSAATINSSRIVTAQHGPGKGVPSLYFFPAILWYRIPLSVITPNFVFWGLHDSSGSLSSLGVIPPGGSVTYPIPSSEVKRGVDYIDNRDLFILSPGNRQNSSRGNVSKYNAVSKPLDKIWVSNSDQVHNTSANSGVSPHLSNAGLGLLTSTINGITYVSRLSSTSVGAQIYAAPFSANWDFNDAALITPRIHISDSTKLYNVYFSDVRKLGTGIHAITPEPYRLYYRTGGIKDNSGAWHELNSDGDLSAIKANEIQFSIRFKTIGNYCVPSRIHAVSIVYERNHDLPTNYRWNFTDSSALNGVFGFIQQTSFGGSPPEHTIEIRRLDNEQLLISQSSAAATTHGVFEYWSGTAWLSGLGPNTVGTRRRFRTTGSIPGGIDLYAKILI